MGGGKREGKGDGQGKGKGKMQWKQRRNPQGSVWAESSPASSLSLSAF